MYNLMRPCSGNARVNDALGGLEGFGFQNIAKTGSFVVVIAIGRTRKLAHG